MKNFIQKHQNEMKKGFNTLKICKSGKSHKRNDNITKVPPTNRDQIRSRELWGHSNLVDSAFGF